MGEAAPRMALTRVCRECNRELPLTTEFYRTTTGSIGGGWRAKCRRCGSKAVKAREKELRTIARAVEAQAPPAKWTPRVVGEGGIEGGFTEHPQEGYRFQVLPDSHGDLVDHEALAGWLAFARYYKPVRVFMIGDHVDLSAFSRFDGPPSDRERIEKDVKACRELMGLVRESAPNARITYLKGNHEARFQKHLWKNETLAALLKCQGMDLPRVLGLSDFNIGWEESGAVVVNERLLVKHGHVVRKNSASSAAEEVRKNGCSVIMGHVHRLGQFYVRSRAGVMTGVESGCICQYDPAYAEGQVMDWQHGLSFGTVSLKGRGFSVHTAPIIKGRVKALEMDIGA